MLSTEYISPQTLTRQAIDALQSGDAGRAHDLLGQAIQLAPDDERAWLWLSGAVATDAERQYCLERVLVINPQNAAARRGLQKLPATLVSRSPLPVAPAASALAAHTWAPGEETLLSILIQPDVDVAPPLAFSSGRPFDRSSAPAPAAASPSEPVAAAAPTADPRAQTAIDFIIREFGRHRSRDEIIRTMSEQHGYAWKEAEQFVSEVETDHRRAIATRQSPFLIFLGVITIIGGCFLAARAGYVLYGFYFRLSAASILSARGVVVMCGQLVTGIAMMLGATIGLGQTIKSLWS